MYTSKNRPLSPHLTIYKAQDTSLVSILQRISGVLLFLILFVIYLGHFFLTIRFFVYGINLNLDFSCYSYCHYIIVSVAIFTIIVYVYHFLKGIYLLLLDTKKC